MMKESKTDLAYRVMRERIDSGAYMPGYRLVIAPIAQELGISAVPIREAIRRLEAEGLITFERNVGAQVALVKETEYLHTMQTLALVEGFATALASPAVTADQITRARRINDTMRQTLDDFDPQRFTQLNLDFHSVLFESCPNPHVLELVHRGWNRMRVLRNSSFTFVPGRAHESVEEHERLLALIESGSAAELVEQSAREHRLATLRAVLARNAEHDEGEALTA
ncbi:GntR family transcriptional regulator [Leucobacter sp. UCMA 4100]|uniref:GntR family transcriptional regulator n=1 Tax=Leucobacter sp. UCMA 4100 TaxID=2810534 RepID=UPI0022EA31FA|nr:GntR family transcriptional regulator [Leucobacter sp. UCMA 4100]MDA3147316.1 GntR family transcriptional regulator [Leucobacter sp. UCMA 4100]